MSQWTSITGALRLDGVPNMMPNCTVESIKKLLGHTCGFDSPSEGWKVCTVPCGSEGSIQYLVHEYSDGLPWVVVTIWGDLRDFGSGEQIEEVKKWFYGICKEYPLVRQGILQIRVDGVTTILQHNDEVEV
jgi:hypothetical protein